MVKELNVYVSNALFKKLKSIKDKEEIKNFLLERNPSLKINIYPEKTL